MSTSESEEHQRIKLEIERALTALKWDARAEWRRTDEEGKLHVADVSASKGDLTIAFEVQLSPQSIGRTIERHRERMNSGIGECWWLFGASAWRTNEVLAKGGFPAAFVGDIEEAMHLSVWVAARLNEFEGGWARTSQIASPSASGWQLVYTILKDGQLPFPCAVSGDIVSKALDGVMFPNNSDLWLKLNGRHLMCGECDSYTDAWRGAEVITICRRCGKRSKAKPLSHFGMDYDTVAASLNAMRITSVYIDGKEHQGSCHKCGSSHVAITRSVFTDERRMQYVAKDAHQCLRAGPISNVARRKEIEIGHRREYHQNEFDYDW